MINEGSGDATLLEDLRTLFGEVQLLCGDFDERLPAELAEVQDRFSDEELRAMLTALLVHIRGGGDASAHERALMAAEVRSIVEAAVARRREAVADIDEIAGDVEDEIGPAAIGSVVDEPRIHLPLFDADGLHVRPVTPEPMFLGRPVRLTEGFVDTLDVRFWEDNFRIELDLENFRRREGRDPDPDELRQLLWPKGDSPRDDTYKIVALADDIASRGVQHPPVIDYWGTAWDGNRRIAACRFILASADYTTEQKARARRIRVWQTDQHATKDQIDAIVTSLNFGEEFKLPWPEFVRARKVYDAYLELRDSQESRRVLSERDEIKIRQDIAKAFGIKTAAVTRYCKMMVWALEFQDYHREQERDEVEIANRTNTLFQYFYELDSGRGDNKLALKLRDDEGFRAIVFDLMFDGKFKNWSQIRELRRVYDNPEALDELKQAHRETSTTIGREHVSEAIDLARQHSVALRQAGRGDELARITKWLNEDVTLAVLRKLDVSVLREFRDAVRAVDSMISSLVDTPAPVAPEQNAS